MKHIIFTVLLLSVTLPLAADELFPPPTISPCDPYAVPAAIPCTEVHAPPYIAGQAWQAVPLNQGSATQFVWSDSNSRPGACTFHDFDRTPPAVKKSEAEAGDMARQLQLAADYEDGTNGCEKDNAEALKWYQKSADQGFIPAMYRLAVWYERGDGPLEKDMRQAMAWYEKCADAGSDDAQVHLAKIYLHGHDDAVPADRDLAIQWYRKAAAQADRNAITFLRNLRVEEELRPKAEAGDAAAQYLLARHLKKTANSGMHSGCDFCATPSTDANVSFNIRIPMLGVKSESPMPEYLQWTRKSADQGYAPAQTALAMIGFLQFRDADTANFDIKDAEVFRLLQQAADQENADALLWLAMCYAQGKGVKRDDKKAVQLLQQADEKGNEHAAQLLAYAYAQGTGVQANGDKALQYLKKSTARQYGQVSMFGDTGDRESQLAEIYITMHNHAEAVRWLKAALQKGNRDAHAKLAGYYIRGRHVPRNPGEAVRLLRGAEDYQSTQMLSICHYLGWGVPADEAEAIRIAEASRERYTQPMMSDEIAISQDDAIRLQLCQAALVLCGMVGDLPAMEKCMKQVDEIAARYETLNELQSAEITTIRFLFLILRDQPGDTEKLCEIYRKEATSDVSDAEICLQAVQCLLQFDLPDHAMRWLDKSGKRDTLSGKAILAQLRQLEKRPSESLLKYIRANGYADGQPNLDGLTVQDTMTPAF